MSAAIIKQQLKHLNGAVEQGNKEHPMKRKKKQRTKKEEINLLGIIITLFPSSFGDACVNVVQSQQQQKKKFTEQKQREEEEKQIRIEENQKALFEKDKVLLRRDALMKKVRFSLFFSLSFCQFRN
jgi:hypothetical protein